MIDPIALRGVLGRFATGVTVVSTLDSDGEPCGLTVNSFTSVSLEPPLVLVCIDHRADNHAHLLGHGWFGISVLSESQEALSRRFASRERRKFDGLDQIRGHSGVPLLVGALAHLECRLVEAFEAGDHTILLGRVERLTQFGGRPLLFYGGAYHRIAPGA
jgi:flavin reductase (DIM6/NTAB) family NADH-FMN oxidoreductase RutF